MGQCSINKTNNIQFAYLVFPVNELLFPGLLNYGYTLPKFGYGLGVFFASEELVTPILYFLQLNHLHLVDWMLCFIIIGFFELIKEII
jgi:hypothetical protein